MSSLTRLGFEREVNQVLAMRNGRVTFLKDRVERLSKSKLEERLKAIEHMRPALSETPLETAVIVGRTTILAIASSSPDGLREAVTAFDNVSWLFTRQQRQEVAQKLADNVMKQSVEYGWELARLAAELDPLPRKPLVARAIASLDSRQRDRTTDRTLAQLLDVSPAGDLLGPLAQYQRSGTWNSRSTSGSPLAPYLGPESLTALASQWEPNQRLRMLAQLLQTVIGCDDARTLAKSGHGSLQHGRGVVGGRGAERAPPRDGRSQCHGAGDARDDDHGIP